MEQERYPAKQQSNTGTNANHQQHRPAMVLDVEKGFLECVLCFLCRTFCRWPLCSLRFSLSAAAPLRSSS